METEEQREVEEEEEEEDVPEGTFEIYAWLNRLKRFIKTHVGCFTIPILGIS